MSISPKVTVTDPTNSAVVQWKQTYNGTLNSDTLGPGQSKSYSGIFSATVASANPATATAFEVEDMGTADFTATETVQHNVPAGGPALSLTAQPGQYSNVRMG